MIAGNRARIPVVAFVLALGAWEFIGAACVHVPRFPEVRALGSADVEARLRAAALRRVAVDGVAKAALPGLGGAVVNATVDVAAAAPDRLSVAVRSFFEVPQQILVANGDVVTLYDATTGAPRFFAGPASDRTLARVLGVPLSPDDAVALILGRAPLDTRDGRPPPRVRLVAVDDDEGTYTARIERAGRGALLVTARVSDDAIVAVEVWRGDGRPLVRATCGDFVVHDGVAFARRIVLSLVDDGLAPGPRGVVLSMTKANWNPAALPDSAFVLDVPPDQPVLPL
jgi:hypothetical protein